MGEPIMNASPEGIVHNLRAAARAESGMTLWGVDYFPLSVFDRIALLGILDMILRISVEHESPGVQEANAQVRSLRIRLAEFHESCEEMREQLGNSLPE